MALLRPVEQGNVGHLAVTQPLRFALFVPLQPGPVLGLPIQKSLKKQGEEEAQGSVLLADQDTQTSSQQAVASLTTGRMTWSPSMHLAEQPAKWPKAH